MRKGPAPEISYASASTFRAVASPYEEVHIDTHAIYGFRGLHESFMASLELFASMKRMRSMESTNIHGYP